MITENLLNPPFPHQTPIGYVEMPQMYPPKLTPEECKTLDWKSFRDGLQPMLTFSYPDKEGMQIAVTRKSSLWTPADVCCFVGGSHDIFTIEDMSQDEGKFYLLFNQTLASFLNTFSSKTKNHYQNITVAFGFNPEDFQLGAHSIRRLHTHIFTPHHRITDGDLNTPQYRQEKPWQQLTWFDRLKFSEPFTLIYKDRLNHLLSQGFLADYLEREGLEEHCGFLSFYLKAGGFHNTFPMLQTIYQDLHTTYSGIEAIFTDRKLDENDRFPPLPVPERTTRLNEYLSRQNTSWLSDDSRNLLTILSQRLKNAAPRDTANRITTSAQAWMTKGFAGTILLQFLKGSDVVRLDFAPRVLTTSAPEKLIYGIDRPTVIKRVPRCPTEEEQSEYEEYNYAIQIACQRTYEFLMRNKGTNIV